MSKPKYVFIVVVNASTRYDMDDEVIKIAKGKVVSVHTTYAQALTKARDYYRAKKPTGFVEVIQKRVCYDDSK